MPESLSFENFFTKFYILDHEAQNLIKEDQTKTLVYSVMLRIFTLGLVHLGCVIAQAIQKGSVAKGGTDTNTDQKVKDQAKKAQVTTPTKPATKPPSSEDKVRSFLMICDALERGEALEEDMKKSLIEVLALKRSPEQQIRLITVARSLKLDPEIFTQSNKSPEEILSDLNFEIGTLPLGLTLKDLIRSVKNILQPATETKGKKPDVAAPRITLESFIKLCDDMEAGKELKGVKSSLANALMLPRSSQQEADFQDLLDQLNLKSADFAHLNFQPLYETVKDFSAKQLSDLCFGLKTLLTKTNEKKAEQTKEKEKEKEKEALLAHLNEICNKIEKGHLTKGMNLTSTLVKLLAQKRNPAETENFQNLLSNLILDPKLLNTTRAALKIWKKNPERSTQTQIRADLTGIAYNDQKRLCLEVRKLYSRQPIQTNQNTELSAVAYFDEIETRLKQIFEYDEEIKDLHNKLENHLRGKERKEYDFLTCLWKLTLDDEAFYNSGLLDELKVKSLTQKEIDALNEMFDEIHIHSSSNSDSL